VAWVAGLAPKDVFQADGRWLSVCDRVGAQLSVAGHQLAPAQAAQRPVLDLDRQSGLTVR
jgi:hypothetical protein